MKLTLADLRFAFRRFVRSLLWGLAGVAAFVTAVSVWLYARAADGLDANLRPRVVNDVTQLNPTQVGRVVTPHDTGELAALLRDTQGPVSIGGARCSMGGQVSEPGSLHIDMRQMNSVLDLSKEQRTITVEAGIRWRDILDAIDPHDLSIKIMQTYANFSVGGSLSVNAHGRYMGRGPVVQSVRSIELVLADGSVVTASREENPELFYGAIGGYGGLGVLAEVTLDLVPNEKVERHTQVMETKEYAAFFADSVRTDEAVVFHNADMHPPDFDTVRAVSWKHSEAELTEEERLIPRDDEYTWTPFLINESGFWPLGSSFRKHVLEPLFYARDVVTYRNHEASYDIAEIEPSSRDDSTFVLREYFIPVEQFDAFVPKMQAIFRDHEVDVANISVRHASPDPGTLLAWARGETFAFVVYYEQGTDQEAIDDVARWSRAMVDAVLSVGGTYYLPYQNHATREQFLRGYPRAEEFFALKARVDPQLRFQNALFHRYGPSPRAELEGQLAEAGYVHKPEGQTLLTVPEWYLVFNPVEYADLLRSGRASDEFPFFASVEEYWSLYKRVRRLSAGVYDESREYLTMLRVIGISTSVEYVLKGSYEATVGRFVRWLDGGSQSKDEKLIAEAYTAYAELIFHEPWYVFDFLPWVSRVWGETSFFGPDFLRRTERKLAFSAEFVVKAAYAELLGWAAQSTYDAPAETVHVLVRSPDRRVLVEDTRVRLVSALEGNRYLIEVPRWGPFSEILPALAASGVEILQIAGNDDVAVSVVGPASKPRAADGTRLFRSRMLTLPDDTRSVWLVRVESLAKVLRGLDGRGLKLEHIYDY